MSYAQIVFTDDEQIVTQLKIAIGMNGATQCIFNLYKNQKATQEQCNCKVVNREKSLKQLVILFGFVGKL